MIDVPFLALDKHTGPVHEPLSIPLARCLLRCIKHLPTDELIEAVNVRFGTKRTHALQQSMQVLESVRLQSADGEIGLQGLSVYPSSECFVQATYQVLIAERLAQKSYRAGADRAASRLRFREGGDKDNGNVMPLGDKMILQLYPDMPGICTSVIRQSVLSTAFELTNASADGNAAVE